MRILALLLAAIAQGQNCPDGWKYHEKNCYYFSGVPDSGTGVTFGVAESECQHMGGHLLATLGLAEQQWLIQQDDLREMFGKVFIGAHKTNGKFTWTSGDEWKDKWEGNIPSQKKDLPWKEDEPVNDPKKLCVTMDMRKVRPGGLGDWEMESCARPHTFVCKMSQNAVVINCNDGFVEAENMCWLRVHEKMNFLDAQKACEAKGSYLAEIRNQQESYAFMEYMKSSTAESGPFWIGLRHDEGSQNPEKFTWQNSQEPLRFNEWLEGYPILSSPVENTCAFTEWDTDVEGRWMTTACDSEEYNFVCQHDLGLVCPKNWLRNDDMCYKNFDTPAYRRSWTDAVNFCDDIGAEMVMIKDKETQTFLALNHASLLQIGVQDYWIGLSTTRDAFQSPEWIDGSRITYSELVLTDQPYSPYCVQALTSASEANWQDAYCGNPRAFICQAKVGTRLYEPSEGMLDYLCESDTDNGEDWHFLNNTESGELSCYMISQTPTSWNRGSKICQDAGGYLTSITSQREQDFVEHLLYKKSIQMLSGDAWIGLKTTKGAPRNRKKYDGIPNDFWEDGKKYEFNNWADNMPQYSDNSDSWEGDCVCLYGLDHPTIGAWANKDCTKAFDKRPVCKRPMTKNPDTTPPGIIDEDQKEANIKYCGAPQWRWNADFKSCYNVIDSVMPWDTQRKTCADNGGFMLDITSPKENQYVQTLVALLPGGAFWTGGFDAGRENVPPEEDINIGQRNGNWKWDRITTPLPYFNWESDQPNLPELVGPTCIEITANGKWSNPECTERRYTICERNPVYTDPVDPEEECDGPECCSGHIGVENGGAIAATAFYSNSENRTSSSADHGRLNRPYDMWGYGGYGGWLAEKNAKDPYLQVTFDQFYEVRGIITQGPGVDGGAVYGVQNFKEWSRTFAIRYAIGDGEYTDLVDDVGQTKLFDGNYDTSSQVVNMFPQTLITKSIRVYPRRIKNNYAGLRMELIGCKATCVDSLGAARNPPSGVKIPDSAFKSSSDVSGHEAFHGRVVYSETRTAEERKPHQISVSTSTKSHEDAEDKCQNEYQGNGDLVSIHNSEDQELIQGKIQSANPNDEDTCFWIGLDRKSSNWHWVDGTILSYDNWAAGEPKTGNCACMDSSKGFKWFARSCSSLSPYVCEGTVLF